MAPGDVKHSEVGNMKLQTSDLEGKGSEDATMLVEKNIDARSDKAEQDGPTITFDKIPVIVKN